MFAERICLHLNVSCTLYLPKQRIGVITALDLMVLPRHQEVLFLKQLRLRLSGVLFLLCLTYVFFLFDFFFGSLFNYCAGIISFQTTVRGLESAVVGKMSSPRCGIR